MHHGHQVRQRKGLWPTAPGSSGLSFSRVLLSVALTPCRSATANKVRSTDGGSRLLIESVAACLERGLPRYGAFDMVRNIVETPLMLTKMRSAIQ